MPRKKPAYIDDPCQVTGEGITRCSSPGARLWRYQVRFQLGRPLTGEIQALDRHQAKQLLQNRHPDATVEVLR